MSNAKLRKDAVDLILGERARQDAKWGQQRHGMFTWLAILHEETGELSEACLHARFGGPEADNILKEAVQVAAVACQIVERLLLLESLGRKPEVEA